MSVIPSGWTPEQARKRLEAATAIAVDDMDSIHQIGARQELHQHAPTDIAALLALLDEAREALDTILMHIEDANTPYEALAVAATARAFLARFADSETDT